MSNVIAVFDERVVLGKTFRIYGDAENPLFLARDVAEWIEYSKSGNGSYDVSKMLDIVADEEKVPATTKSSRRKTWLLTEDGLFEVLMQSRKPIAKQFKKQVKIILKSIRQNGMYATDELLDDPQLLLKTVAKLKEERVARLHAEQQMQIAIHQNMKLKAIVEEQKPKVEQYELFLNSDGLTDMSSLAKILALKFNGNILGRNQLFGRLRAMELLTARNLPKQRLMDKGYFVVKVTMKNDRNYSTTLVTPQGVDWLVGKLRKESENNIIFRLAWNCA